MDLASTPSGGKAPAQAATVGAKRYYQYRCGTRLRTHDPR
jgi:hypothetical protein